MAEETEVHDNVTIEKAAEIIGVSPDMILSLIAEGKLKSIQIGIVEMVSRHELDQLAPDDYMGIYLVK
jgi:excisionase family DNA binding protein